jgi:hypothetical protein
MTSRDFCYWLIGFFELSDKNMALTSEQAQMIKNHLKLVFLYEIDPSYSDDKTVQQIFQNIHDGKKPLEGLEITNKPVYKPRPHTDRPDMVVKC